jgi:hypothetical protein
VLFRSVDVVPILYEGPYKENIIEETKGNLKLNGSKLVPGWMKPEGIVIFFPELGLRKKSVFSQEEIAWKGQKSIKVIGEKIDHWNIANDYLQPIRLQKLFIKEENYLKNYPETLPELAKEYINDLIKETEKLDDLKLISTKKVVFSWIKQIYVEYMENKENHS